MTTPRPAAPDPAREDERRQKLAALRARLHEDAQALRTPGDWAARLRLAALMPGEDFANILLISSQRPGATMVQDYRQWTAAGRQVRRREKGIETFRIPPPPAPRPQDRGERDELPPTWRDANRVAYVWDLSQTTGQPVPVPAGLPPPGHAPPGLWDALCWLARREGFTVERENGAPADGTTFWAARRIRLLPGLSGDQDIWALAHQLGHVLLHSTPGGHPPGTTSGCTGLRKAEADSVAYITCARHGVTVSGELAYPASWAGRDPRAQPAATVLAAGHRITASAARITRHTARILRGDTAPAIPPPAQLPTPATRPRPPRRGTAAEPQAEPTLVTRRILQHAQDFYTARLAGSWAPAYLDSRGITAAVAAEWHIGYAPAEWTALTDYLRRLPRSDDETEAAGIGHPRRAGYSDDEIEAAGVAKVSSRGTLIDSFRDRVMLPVHEEHGEIAGFISRAHPDRESDDAPRYLNSAESASYKKGNLLFGLHQGRQALARGAVPVIVEGPFDAIAVTLADPGRLVGLAPCGTALTAPQAELVSQAADLPRVGILVAFDSDTAGRKAAVRAHGILRPHIAKVQSARLTAKDPAKILQQDGPAALRAVLRDQEPLSALLVDARIATWERRLDDPTGQYLPISQYLAMLDTAILIADLLPDETARQIRRITAERELHAFDDQLRHVDNPELAEIARILPAETTYHAVRTAAKLDFDASDVLTVVANAVTLGARSPKGQEPTLRDKRERTSPALRPEASRLAGTSFPVPPLSPPPAGAARAGGGSRPRPQASAPRRAAGR